jgi:hypothetical protein
LSRRYNENISGAECSVNEVVILARTSSKSSLTKPTGVVGTLVVNKKSQRVTHEILSSGYEVHRQMRHEIAD